MGGLRGSGGYERTVSGYTRKANQKDPHRNTDLRTNMFLFLFAAMHEKRAAINAAAFQDAGLQQGEVGGRQWP